jgi:xylan 1,4-beta-xylosidase
LQTETTEERFLNQNNSEKRFCNPILPGFYPDPSVCRAEDHYYLVTSSFAYFPGIPVFHSQDLVHWEQLGHVLERPSQLDLDGVAQSEGIYAPTIRYHHGIFFVISTNLTKGGNFVVTATNPAGPWSEPYWLRDAPGIDPSLFFDEDGRAYYVGTRPAPEGERYYGNWEIWLREFDPVRLALTGSEFSLWRGALREAIWPEGPHIYFKDGWYYLMIAEGGTDYHHAVTIARSRKITGPYEGNPANPILTHRHLGRSCPITNTGHADLVETSPGEWWMVLLGSRPFGGYYRNLGRETFLVPVIWEDGWPVASPGSGKVEASYRIPALPEFSVAPVLPRDDFEQSRLGPVWNFIRTPRDQFWSLTERPGYLRLKLKPERLDGPVNPAFIGRRIQHIHFSASTAVEFVPEHYGESAGMVLFQNRQYYFRMEITPVVPGNRIRLIRTAAGVETELAAGLCAGERIYLKITGSEQEFGFYYGSSEKMPEVLAEQVDGRILSPDVAGGFVGAYVGLFAASNGVPSRNRADFDWFEYKEEY